MAARPTCASSAIPAFLRMLAVRLAASFPMLASCSVSDGRCDLRGWNPLGLGCRGRGAAAAGGAAAAAGAGCFGFGGKATRGAGRGGGAADDALAGAAAGAAGAFGFGRRSANTSSRGAAGSPALRWVTLSVDMVCGGWLVRL